MSKLFLRALRDVATRSTFHATEDSAFASVRLMLPSVRAAGERCEVARSAVVGQIATQRMNLIQGDTGGNYCREYVIWEDVRVSKKIHIIVSLNTYVSKLNM